jgi:hypothetical protein
MDSYKPLRALVTIIVAGVLTVGCSTATSAGQTLQVLHPNKPFVVAIDSAEFSTDVAVLDPHGRFLWMRSEDMHCSGLTYANGRISIFPGKAYGRYWDNGTSRDVPVFSEAGIYTIYVSDNLETELDNSAAVQYRVRYVSRRDAVHPEGSCKAKKGDRGN